MPPKGFNTILIDFDALIDRELSWVMYFRSEYRDASTPFFNKHEILYTDINILKFRRVLGREDLFSSFILSEDQKSNYTSIFDELWNRDKKDILKNYAVHTSMLELIRAYKVAGGGTVKCSVRCSDDDETSCVSRICPDANTIKSTREDIDMNKYGRVIVGNYKDALRYSYPGPRSIGVLDFRENFMPNDISLLNVELITMLGDVNDIEVVSAYAEFSETKQQAAERRTTKHGAVNYQQRSAESKNEADSVQSSQ